MFYDDDYDPFAPMTPAVTVEQMIESTWQCIHEQRERLRDRNLTPMERERVEGWIEELQESLQKLEKEKECQMRCLSLRW